MKRQISVTSSLHEGTQLVIVAGVISELLTALLRFFIYLAQIGQILDEYVLGFSNAFFGRIGLVNACYSSKWSFVCLPEGLTTFLQSNIAAKDGKAFCNLGRKMRQLEIKNVQKKTENFGLRRGRCQNGYKDDQNGVPFTASPFWTYPNKPIHEHALKL